MAYLSRRTLRRLGVAAAILAGTAIVAPTRALEPGTYWQGGCLVTYYYETRDGYSKSGKKVDGYRRYELNGWVHFCMPV